jgi:hypothetical protein
VTNRRGFLGSILVAGMAPAVVGASSIMRVRPVLDSGHVLWTSVSAGVGNSSLLNDGLRVCCFDSDEDCILFFAGKRRDRMSHSVSPCLSASWRPEIGVLSRRPSKSRTSMTRF